MALVVKSPVSNRWNARFLSFKKKKKPSLTFFTRKPLKVKITSTLKKKKKLAGPTTVPMGLTQCLFLWWHYNFKKE
jgi:hypothetical protein